jgi:tetratricopeptide (TPR) repeat protein
VWSLKLRALATAGLSNEALAALRTVPAADLARLPCDTDYLGTLGHVTRAALRLGAREYYETLYSLLSRYPEHYSGGVSFFCEGAVAQLCGMLAQELGQRAKAITHFELAIRMNDRAGLEPRAAETRLQLSRCLLEHAKRGGKEHALTLAGDARVRATRLGITRLSHEASALRARAQSAHTV